LQTLHDLKGRRVAFGRGSSAHNLTVAALEKAGLRYDEIQPIYLGPADAGAAFERGAIDAWTVWDPYYALAEARPGVRVLAKWTDITEQNSFFMARRAYAEGNAATVARIVAGFVEVGTWARAHRSALADRLAAATGMPDDAMQRAVGRAPFEVFAMNDEVMASQQTVADRFLRIGVIPERIQIADAVWRAPRT
jgi:NitT/TauT family transport system substrate-binding protein/sulfonate transport system substrate-binding protein